jgi:hypothetical protein
MFMILFSVRSAFDIFTSDSGPNPLLACTESNHPSIDLTLWQENDGGNAPGNTRQPKTLTDRKKPYCDFGGRIGLPGGDGVRMSACTECRCVIGGGEGECQTVRVRSCADLFDDVGREAVRVDESCIGQC